MSCVPLFPAMADLLEALRILGGGVLLPGGPFGAARGLDAVSDSQMSVCLSEVPIGSLRRLVDRHSQYGIAFTQQFLSENGGARVWDVDRDTPVQRAVEALKAERLNDFDRTDDFWRVTPFIDFPGEYGETLYRFEWEREWRVPGELHFKPDDVSFLLIPEEQHEQAREFFSEAEHGGTGPNYRCPFLDPEWRVERVAEALQAHHDSMRGATTADGRSCPLREVLSGQLCLACGEMHG